jgi:hypothetical protein
LVFEGVWAMPWAANNNAPASNKDLNFIKLEYFNLKYELAAKIRFIFIGFSALQNVLYFCTRFFKRSETMGHKT